MSACQTWATSSQFRHPWYDTQTMKRKGRDNDTPTVSPPLTKRQRRYSDLEEGFAYMSLANQPPYRPFAPDTISVQEIPVSTIMDAEMSSASSSPSLRPQAYTVEEPTIPEVNMKKSSWYEPERDREYFILGAFFVRTYPYSTRYCHHGSRFFYRVRRRR